MSIYQKWRIARLYTQTVKPPLLCQVVACIFLVAVFLIVMYGENSNMKAPLLSPEFARFRNGNRSFSHKYLPILNDLDLIDPQHCTNNGIYEENITFVSAWSQNHHGEGYHLAVSLREYKGLRAGQKKLIVYNLGLSNEQVKDYSLEFGCLVEFRLFNFSMYPDYVRNLKEYRWKPLIIAMALREFPAVWWVDSSMNFVNEDRLSFKAVYEALRTYPNHTLFGITDQTTHSIFAATHPGMYEFLPIDTEKSKHQTMGDASHMLWYGTRKTKSELLKWFVWCALEEECMTPKGANITCQFQADRYLYYAQCNRYDQSAISIIATASTDFQVNSYLLNKTVSPLRTVRTAA